jgi:hypothetical protein
VSNDFFDRLEIDLVSMVRDGRHLSPAQQHDRRRMLLIKRVLLLAVLVIALAASLASEFPASANGRTGFPAASLVQAP